MNPFISGLVVIPVSRNFAAIRFLLSGGSSDEPRTESFSAAIPEMRLFVRKSLYLNISLRSFSDLERSSSFSLVSQVSSSVPLPSILIPPYLKSSKRSFSPASRPKLSSFCLREAIDVSNHSLSSCEIGNMSEIMPIDADLTFSFISLTRFISLGFINVIACSDGSAEGFVILFSERSL